MLFTLLADCAMRLMGARDLDPKINCYILMDSQEQGALASYLKNGGNIFVVLGERGEHVGCEP